MKLANPKYEKILDGLSDFLKENVEGFTQSDANYFTFVICNAVDSIAKKGKTVTVENVLAETLKLTKVHNVHLLEKFQVANIKS